MSALHAYHRGLLSTLARYPGGLVMTIHSGALAVLYAEGCAFQDTNGRTHITAKGFTSLTQVHLIPLWEQARRMGAARARRGRAPGRGWPPAAVVVEALLMS